MFDQLQFRPTLQNFTLVITFARISSLPLENDDVRFTVTMPYELASVIDRLRKPSKTSRQAWLMQAAIEKLKKDGEM